MVTDCVLDYLIVTCMFCCGWDLWCWAWWVLGWVQCFVFDSDFVFDLCVYWLGC